MTRPSDQQTFLANARYFTPRIAEINNYNNHGPSRAQHGPQNFASVDLKEHFARNANEEIRLTKVAIQNEKLVLDGSVLPQGTWQDDFILIESMLEECQPCYILYRLDSKNDMGYEWIYFCYSPDNSPVREKMLYAATKATLKSEFGGGKLKDEIFITYPHEATFESYKRHMVRQAGPAPLTMAEEELEMIKKSEVRQDIHVDSKHQTIQGVAFPVSQEAIQALKNITAGASDYVQLSLDLSEERIILEREESLKTEALSSRIPTDHARYHFFRFKHTHEGDYMESIVFIYSMPGYKCPIKERMLYSSCKSPMLSMVEQHTGMVVEKKLEVGEPEEVTEKYLYEEVHPTKNVARQKFSKPKPPAGRGPRRMMKPATEES